MNMDANAFRTALTWAVIFFCLPAFAQNFPTDKFTDWSKVGIQNELSAYDTVDVVAQGMPNDGITPCDQSLGALLNASTNPTVFYFPAGEYYFTKPIQLEKAQVLKGASSDETHFIFDLQGQNHLIEANGKVLTDTAWLLSAAWKDSVSILTDAVNGSFKAGDFVKFVSEDDDLVTSDWARYSTGQICQIKKVQNGKITLTHPTRRDYLMEDLPRIVKTKPVQFVGVECLSLERKDSTSTQTSNIFFNLAANCNVSGIASQYCNFAHVTLQQSTQVEVTGCHFQDAFDYGGGGKAYGVALQLNSGDCLIQNNTFQHLRHSMLLQAGANGNVLSYNYSLQPFWTETNLPTVAAGDLVLHGNYVYANLFEGNIVQNIVIDDSHGKNGPNNTFFRNRAELFGIFMNSNPASPGQVFIGNEVTAMSPFAGFYILEGGSHFEYANNVKGTLLPTTTDSLPEQSLYLSDEPSFFAEMEMPFAPIGFPNSLNGGSIPAKAHFLAGVMTSCEPLPPPVVSGSDQTSTMEKRVYPNPTTGVLYLDFEGNKNLKLLDINGKLVLQTNLAEGEALLLPPLPSGVYYLFSETGGHLYSDKIIML
ncbi:MAG: T9SS type A sorting domain-containing protein [Bacteroidetes bacterium]|nr:T9SS type A sorting domain-containing protein [Bacteroidota bacterium]